MALAFTSRSTPTAVSHFWKNICWSPELSLFVAVGGVNASGTNPERVMTSPDGITWTARSIGVSAANTLGGICWSPTWGLFIATKTSGTNRVTTSPDGINWTDRTIPSANAWQAVKWSPSLAMAVAVSSGGTNRSMRCEDGINWMDNAVPARSWTALEWCPGIGKFVAASTSGGHVMWCTLGHTWTEQTSVFGLQSIGSVAGLAWSESLSLLVAVMGGNSNPVWTSPDAITWTQRTCLQLSGNRNLYGVAWSPELSLFVAVGGDGTNANLNQIRTSSDGITWAEIDPNIGANRQPWVALAWAPVLNRFAILSDNTDNDGTSVMTAEVSTVPLAITSITPESGYTRGGLPVTIVGTSFTTNLTIDFGGVAATEINVVSNTVVTCVYPVHAAGTIVVTVTNPDNEATTTSFLYITPAISSITPSSASRSGDTVVTIAGNGFLPDSEILFDGILATDIVYVDGQTYTARIPAHDEGVVIVRIIEP